MSYQGQIDYAGASPARKRIVFNPAGAQTDGVTPVRFLICDCYMGTLAPPFRHDKLGNDRGCE